MNRSLRILLYGSNLWYLGEGMLGPLFAVFAERLGGNILDISWAWASYLVVAGFLNIFVGRFSDHFSKEKIMVFGYFLNALFTFGYLFVSVPWHLFFVQVGLGVASALSMPTWTSLYAKHEDKRHDGFVWGLAGGESQIITGCALVVGGLLVNYFSFSVLFVVMGCVQVCAAFYQSRILFVKNKR